MSSRHICCKPKLFALLLVPGVIEVQAAGILAAILLGLGLFGLQFGSLRGLRCCRLLLRLVQLGSGNEDGQLGQPVLRGLVAGNDEDLGIEVGICRRSRFPAAARVYSLPWSETMWMSVVAVRDFRLDADEAAGDMAAIEDPIHGVAGEDSCDLLLGRKQNQRRLQQAGANHRRRVRLGDGDGARSVRLKVMRFGGGVDADGCGSKSESTG